MKAISKIIILLWSELNYVNLPPDKFYRGNSDHMPTTSRRDIATVAKKTIQQTEIRLQEKFQPQREIQAIQGVAAKAISAEANDQRGT